MLGLFAVLVLVFDVLFLLLFLVFLHVAVQVADEELRVRVYVVHGQVEDVLAILEPKRKDTRDTSNHVMTAYMCAVSEWVENNSK